MELGISEHNLLQIRIEREKIVLSRGGVPGMCTMGAHVKAASQTGVLIGVYQPHAFDNPEDTIVDHLSEIAHGGDILDLTKLLEPAFLLTCHLG